MPLTDKINEPNDIKKIPESELKELAVEIRRMLIKSTAANGGHLASNLGVVELTFALHRYLNFPEDKLIWDVGHQSYVHKILTGRKERLENLRKLDGLSGFPKKNESECDAFGTGHASTSISAALGMVAARDLHGTKEKIVAVIGDGAMTGGMALEALNNAGTLKSNLIIILNDNERSISKNVGGVARYLDGIRTSRKYLKLKSNVKETLNTTPIGNSLFEKLKISKDVIKRLFVPGMFFEDMGITYLGPVNGHSVKELQEALENAGRVDGAVIIHTITRKGLGYKRAEEYPAKFHGVEPFDIKTGENTNSKTGKSYTAIFSDTMLELAAKDERLVTITAAMPYGTGLYNFKQIYPKRFFDVGIAEEHAVTFAAGMAASGLKPVVAIYSTFLQRAYDQIIHDVCLQGLPVVFAVDRAGLVGSDGETHQGIFDTGYLATIPGLMILSPKDGRELKEMLKYAYNLNGPVAVRYPRGTAYEYEDMEFNPIVSYENEIIVRGKNIAIFATGKTVKLALSVSEILKKSRLASTVVNVRFLDKADGKLLEELKENHSLIVTIEESVKTGSYTERLMAESARRMLDYDFFPVTLPDSFIEQGSIDELWDKYGFNADVISEKIKEKVLSKLDDELFRR